MTDNEARIREERVGAAVDAILQVEDDHRREIAKILRDLLTEAEEAAFRRGVEEGRANP